MAKNTKIKAVKGRTHNEEFGSKNEKFMPTLHLDLRELPEARNWEEGTKYELLLHVVQTGMHIRRGGKGSVSFDIVGIGVTPNNPVKNQGKVKRRYTKGS